jgi:O-antigen/teichoic acid export membrane protein
MDLTTAVRSPAVVRTGLLSMLALIALGGTRLIHGLLVGRATDNETYALVGTLIGVAMTAGLFLPGGLASAASKFIPYLRGAGNSAGAYAVYRSLTIIGYAGAGLLGLVVAAGTWALLDLSAANAVSVGLLTAAFSLYSVEKGALYGFDQVSPYVRLELLCSGVAIVSTVVVVVAGWTAYLAPLTLGYAVLVLGGWRTLRRAAASAGPSGGATVESGEIAGFVALASVGGLASAGLLQVLPLLAGRFTSAVEVSYFVAAVVLVTPLYFLPRALGLALFPAMAHAQGAGDTEAVRRQLDLSTRALLVVLAPLFAAALPLARSVLFLFFGPRYADGAAVLQLVLVATYLAVIQVAAVNALSSGSRRDVRVPVFSAVAGLAVGLVFLVPLGRSFGSAGVGVAYLLAVLVQATGPIAVAWQEHRMSWTGPLLRALAVLAGAWILVWRLEPTLPGGVTGVFASIGLAVVMLAAGAGILWWDLTAVLRVIHAARATAR